MYYKIRIRHMLPANVTYPGAGIPLKSLDRAQKHGVVSVRQGGGCIVRLLIYESWMAPYILCYHDSKVLVFKVMPDFHHQQDRCNQEP